MTKILPEHLAHVIPPGHRYFVAGGWAVDPDKAGDIDVWIEAQEMDGIGPGKQLQASYEAVDQHLRRWEAAGAFTIERPDRDESYLMQEGFAAVLVGKLHNPAWEKSIHMLVTCETAEDTINAFDLSVCQVAIQDDGEVVRGRDWTSTTEPIKIVARNNYKTQQRLEKYCQRFGLEAAKPTLWGRVRGRYARPNTGGY